MSPGNIFTSYWWDDTCYPIWSTWNCPMTWTVETTSPPCPHSWPWHLDWRHPPCTNDHLQQNTEQQTCKTTNLFKENLIVVTSGLPSMKQCVYFLVPSPIFPCTCSSSPWKRRLFPKKGKRRTATPVVPVVIPTWGKKIMITGNVEILYYIHIYIYIMLHHFISKYIINDNLIYYIINYGSIYDFSQL